MKNVLLALLSMLSIALVGCAYHYSPMSRQISEANDFAEKKDWETAYRRLEEALTSAPYRDIANDVIKRYPNIASTGIEKAFLSDLRELDTLCNEVAVNAYVQRLSALKETGALSSSRTTIISKSKDVLNKCVSSKGFNITLTAMNEWETKTGASIFAQETRSAGYKRQIDSASFSPDTLDENVIDYAKNSKDEKAYLESKLPGIKWIGHSKATQAVKALFPEYYEDVYKKNHITLNLITDPKKPLLELDLADEFNKHFMVSAFQNNPQANITIIVSELAYEEQSMPEQTVQKYVPWSNMTLSAVLLCYPKNATAIYDVTTGGVVIRYVYKVDILIDNQRVDSSTIRDSIRNSFSRAGNLRYQNVFGGVGVPSCYPNEDVSREFQDSSSPISIENLRKEVFDSLTGKIKEFSQIKKAITFGKK